MVLGAVALGVVLSLGAASAKADHYYGGYWCGPRVVYGGPVYGAPVYAAPVYAAPVYAPAPVVVYSRPAYAYPAYGYPAYSTVRYARPYHGGFGFSYHSGRGYYGGGRHRSWGFNVGGPAGVSFGYSRRHR